MEAPADPIWLQAVYGILGLAILVLFFAGLWRLFVKAGERGWKALVPIYNIYVMIRIAGFGVATSIVMLVLYVVPLINIVVGVFVGIRLAKSFGRGVLFGLGLAFLGFIFVPVLGFGSATYRQPEPQQTGATAPLSDDQESGFR